MARLRDRPGVALLLALLALAVAGTFLVAGFYAQRSDDRADRLARRVAQLDGANASALAALPAAWDSAARFAQPVGATREVPVPPPDPDARTRVRITRLSTFLYVAAARSHDARDTTIAAEATGLLRVEGPVFPMLAAVTARGDVGPPEGFQYLPADPAAGTACGAPAPVGAGPVPGFAVPPGHTAPFLAVERVEADRDSAYRWFGPVGLDTLIGRATVALPAGGPPVPSPVAGISVARGDLTLGWGVGRGVLIVLGRLTVAGPVGFDGVVVALGGVEVTAPGARVAGLLLAEGGPPPVVSANSRGLMSLRFDPCLVADVAWHAGRVRPVADWASLPGP